MNNTSKIEELGKEILADSLRKFPDKWRGYDVYIPIYDKPIAIGFPLVILVNGDDVRLSTAEESLEFLHEDGEDDEEDE